MAQRQTATDFVTLEIWVKVTRLAFGTGSFSGQVQRDLGQESFTRLVRYAYDRGIRFFETAESTVRCTRCWASPSRAFRGRVIN